MRRGWWRTLPLPLLPLHSCCSRPARLNQLLPTAAKAELSTFSAFHQAIKARAASESTRERGGSDLRVSETT
jgi:hypothetical protein